MPTGKSSKHSSAFSPAPERERIDRYHVKGAAATDFGAVVQVDRGVYTDLFGVPDPGVASRHGVLAKYESSSPREITDGLSNTLMISECAGRAAAYVLGRPMTARQFSRYRDDDIVKISGQFLVDEGIGWVDPDSGFSIEGVGDNGVELYGPRMINATNVGEAYSFHRGGAQFLLCGWIDSISPRTDRRSGLYFALHAWGRRSSTLVRQQSAPWAGRETNNFRSSNKARTARHRQPGIQEHAPQGSQISCQPDLFSKAAAQLPAAPPGHGRPAARRQHRLSSPLSR